MLFFPTKLSFWHKILPPTIFSAITLILYYPTLFYQFFFDDLPTITENIHILTTFQNPWDEWYTTNRWISRLVSKFCYKYWGASPTLFRIINLSVHILIGILIFFLVLKLLSEYKKSNFLQQNAYPISILTCGLFLLHPFQTQTTTYICQMLLEGGVTLAVFLVLILFVYASKTANIFLKAILYSCAFFVTSVSAGTKEIIFVLPILVLLVDWFFVAQEDWKNILKRSLIHVMFFVILFGTLEKVCRSKITQIPETVKSAVNLTVENNRGNVLTATPEDKITVKIFFISQFKIILHYLKMYFWPVNICFDYEYRLSNSVFDYDVIFPFAFLLALLVLAIFLFITGKAGFISFCIFWFFVTVFPRSSIFICTELVNDYKCYICSFGVLLFIAIGTVWGVRFISKYLEQLFVLENNRISYPLLFSLLFFSVLGVATKIRNNVWSSEVLFWKDVVDKTPTKARNFNNYGVALAEAGRVQEAMDIYKKACELDPTYAEPVINLAFHYQSMGKTDLALEHYARAINMREVHPEMYHNLGVLHYQNGSYDKAETCFLTAVKYRPYYSRAHFGLAVIYQIKNMPEASLISYQNGLRGDFKTIEHYYQHGVLAEKLSNFDQGIESLERVKEMNPNYKDLALTLGSCYYNVRNFQRASENFGIAYQKDPKNVVLAYNYAQTLMNLRKFDQALPVFEECKKVGDSLPYVPLHVVKCLFEIGQKNKAKKELQNLIKTTKFDFVKNDGIGLLKSIA